MPLRSGARGERRGGDAVVIDLVDVDADALLDAVIGQAERRRTIGIIATEQAYQFGLGAEALAAASSDKLTKEQLGAVIVPLLVASTQPPPLSEIYESIANAWANSAVTPRREDVAVLLDGVKLFPQRLVFGSSAIVHGFLSSH